MLFFTPLVCADNVLELKYQKRLTTEQKAYQLVIESGVNEQFTDLIESLFPFKQRLTLVYGGEEGPLYDPESHTIFIPYTFILDTQFYFAKHRPKQDVEQGVIDTLLHTLLHEAGHALVEDQDIPILGKEEDAVDNLATLIMLGYLDNGTQAALNAAGMFGYESEDGEEYYELGEYAGEHSFDLQRYFSTLCLIYGSDPQANADLLDEVEDDYLPQQRETCEESYLQLNYNWHRYLKGKAQ
ncbi:DUF4344 domain-containing metallopeptidase [Vibrio gallicus]|uniref:DUF4344 domain-containing metallopeptidase n=1 Tax=Vibrio gallicus TaxID=190897 RepID=UPI0021C49600|nr:DUF4344 domain-containing metallopeptidase [Vibrio gallicus]